MNPITKDTPLGTRVVAGHVRGRLVGISDGGWAEVSDGVATVLKRPSEVYLDESAPGTTAWALEQVAAGYAVQREPFLGAYKRMLIDGQKLVVEWLNFGQYEPGSLDLDDITATDWEIAK